MTVPARPIEGAPVDVTWGGVVHDTAVAVDIQSGTGTLPAGGSSTTLGITFARQFNAAPAVILTGRDANGGAQILSVSAVFSTGFTAYQRHRTDGNCVAMPFSWVAIGPRT